MNQLQTGYLSIYPSNRSVPDLNYTSTVPVTVTVTSLLLSSLLLNVAVTTDSLEYSLAFSHNSYYTLLLFSYTSICAASGQTSVSAVLAKQIACSSWCISSEESHLVAVPGGGAGWVAPGENGGDTTIPRESIVDVKGLFLASCNMSNMNVSMVNNNRNRGCWILTLTHSLCGRVQHGSKHPTTGKFCVFIV